MGKLADKKQHSSTFPKDEMINEAGEESFPASDPLAWTLGKRHDTVFSEDKVNHDMTQMLAFEHHVIKDVITIMHGILKKLSSDVKISDAEIDNLNEFFELFVDNFHHQKEKMIFPLLNKGENHLSDYLLHDFVCEQEYGRELITDFIKTFHLFSQGDKSVKEKLINLLKDICDLYTNHIAKEDEYMLPAINKIIETKVQNEMISRFTDMKKKIGENEYLRLINLYKTHA